MGRDQPYAYDYDYQRLVRNYIPVLCLMHRRACLEEVGMFDESLSCMKTGILDQARRCPSVCPYCAHHG